MEIVPSVMQECFIPLQYRFSPEAIKNCLQEVLSEGNINSHVSAPTDNDYMTKKQRDDIIKKHTEQFTTKYYNFVCKVFPFPFCNWLLFPWTVFVREKRMPPSV